MLVMFFSKRTIIDAKLTYQITYVDDATT
jgi:hypothetical protein